MSLNQFERTGRPFMPRFGKILAAVILLNCASLGLVLVDGLHAA